MAVVSAFQEVVFPISVALGSTGGPQRKTEIVTLGSGSELRNARWVDSKRQYDAGSGVSSMADLASVVAFFEEMRGRLTGFRYRDPLDDRSCPFAKTPTPTDQPIGVGDGTTATFQLVKVYGATSEAWTRTIAKPVAGSVVVAVGGTAQTVGTRVTVDVTTGLVTFAAGSIPAAGVTVTAGYLFHVPVRFDTDDLKIDLTQFAAGHIPSIPLLEIRP
jgi:uncharacterized protein (TIGR02217 family)